MILSVLQAIGLFLATNIDDIIVLSLFFARGAGNAARQLESWRVSTWDSSAFSALPYSFPSAPEPSFRPRSFHTSASSRWR